jgi:hypothetical protein
MDVDPADSVGTDDGPQTVADLQRELADGNQFTDAELGINRENRIARSQVSRLLRRALHPFMRSLVVVLQALLFLSVACAFLVLLKTFVSGSSLGFWFLASWVMRVCGFAVLWAC